MGHPLVSRQHCEVFEADGLLMVRDLGSLNGTFVGETRIAEQAMPVKPGDLLTVGPVTFRAVYRCERRAIASRRPGTRNGPTVDAPLPSDATMPRHDEPPKRDRGSAATSTTKSAPLERPRLASLRVANSQLPLPAKLRQ